MPFREIFGLVATPGHNAANQPKPRRITLRNHPRKTDDLTYAERILTIMRERDKPMRPVDIITEYTNRGWPTPPAGNLDNSIRSNLFWLKKTKRILHNQKAGKYRINKVEAEDEPES